MRNYKILFLTILVIWSFKLMASGPERPKPKLIVGIVIDQMRYDYLTRYWDLYSEGGFKKLVREGYNFSNTHFNYVPTHTGPGHASIYSGTTPAVHGIVGNYWYDQSLKRVVYVTEDANVNGIGTSGASGRMSPHQLISTTVSDELRLASNMRSKVYGIALKDRGAILPAGRSGNGAFWMDFNTGNWITSTWYMDSLPKWVQDFNNQNNTAGLLQTPWKTLLPADQYAASTADDTPYESLFTNESRPVFPHDYFKDSNGSLDMIKYHPAGNTITKDFAIAVINGAQLGRDAFTDLLSVSFSTPDYVGHEYGTHAVETQDLYLRLDLEIADLIKQTEAIAGKNNVLFFLTSDHAAMPNPLFLKDRKLNAGIFDNTAVSKMVNDYLNAQYGTKDWIKSNDNFQIYLDRNLLKESKADYNEVCANLAALLSGLDDVAYILTPEILTESEFNWGIKSMVQKGFYPKRSGDIIIVPEPGVLIYKTTGTHHGSGYTYDTHAPLIFYGAGIRHGHSVREINITDIAPTLSQMLGIQPPNGTTGKVIEELFGK